MPGKAPLVSATNKTPPLFETHRGRSVSHQGPWGCTYASFSPFPVQPGQGCASPLRLEAPQGGSLEEEEKSGCLWAQTPRLEAPGGHADPCVLCLHPTGCSKMWDNLTCWPATPRGQVVVLACPLIFKLFSPIQGKNPGLKGRSLVAGVEPAGVGTHLSRK